MKIKKIIRDKIPTNAASNKSYIPVMMVDNELAIKLLYQKLDEEVAEFKEEFEKLENYDALKVAEEAADIIEVLECLIEKISIDKMIKLDLNQIKKNKVFKNGSFKSNVCMLES